MWFTAGAFRKLLSIYVFNYFPFGSEGRICDLIVSVPDHCLCVYLDLRQETICFKDNFRNASLLALSPTMLSTGRLKSIRSSSNISISANWMSYDSHSVYSKPFEPKFGTENQYLRSYPSLFHQNQPPLINIEYDYYKNSYAFWGYGLTPDQGADQGHLQPINTGNLRLDLQFATALDDKINVIVYAEFDSLIEINGLRVVITDY